MDYELRRDYELKKHELLENSLTMIEHFDRLYMIDGSGFNCMLQCMIATVVLTCKESEITKLEYLSACENIWEYLHISLEE